MATNNRAITAANAVIMLSADGLFPVPQQIQGFARDRIFTSDAVERAETMMGVDGRLSAGFVYNEVPMAITLMGDSPSNDFFEALDAAEQRIGGKYILTGLVRLKAIGRSYVLTRGFLMSMPIMPGLARTIEPRTYGLRFEKLSPAPI